MPESFMDLANQARARIREIDVPGTLTALREGSAVIIDVREPDEFAQGRIDGAVNIPRGVAEMAVPRFVPDSRRRIICYCAGGNRSALVADNLGRMGYENVESLAGGFQAWARAGNDIVR